MRGLSLILAFVVAAGFAATLPETAYACSCAAPAGGSEEESARGAVQGARAVFAGEVDSIERLSLGTVLSSGAPVQVNFDVSRVWKGPGYETLTVETERSEASCGYDFDVGRRYLVYAGDASPSDGGSETLQVNLCGATTQVRGAEAVSLLGDAGVVPDTENPNPRGLHTMAALPDTGGASLTVLGAALVGVATTLLVRRWIS